MDEAAPVWCRDRGSDPPNRKEPLQEKRSPDSATRQVKDVRALAAASGLSAEEIETKGALIQALIRWAARRRGGVGAEGVALAGARSRRTGGPAGVVRWGQTTYAQFQRPRTADAGLFRTVLRGLTCRQYEAGAEAVPEAFGLSVSSVSRRFIRASARHWQRWGERRRERDEFVALGLEGKTFAEDAMVIALGITRQGQKQILVSSRRRTENERVCAAFLRALVEHGVRAEPGLLGVIDGATGLRPALQTVFGAQALVQRYQWHKRENVVRYLPKAQPAAWRRRLQQATSGRHRPRLEPPWAGSARSCGGSTSPPWPAWTKAGRRR